METKKCFRCEEIKELEEFYKHPGMKDGRVNKCKECNKKDVQGNYSKKSQDKEWRNKERLRCRDKYKRLSYNKKYNSENIPERFKDSRLKNMRRSAASAGLINDENEELHHWNYHKLYSVYILDSCIHKRIHQRMVFDEKSWCFINEDGVLMDTMEKHTVFLKNIINDFRIYTNIKIHFIGRGNKA